MSVYITPRDSIDDAWLATMRGVEDAGGAAVNCITTVLKPSISDGPVRFVVDEYLQVKKSQSITTVAGTIFPIQLYADPQISWSPGMATEDERKLDDAAQSLYGTYEDMLPLLLTANGNRQGTYFSRMITWPGKKAGGTNQLADRVKQLRRARTHHDSRSNVADLTLEGAAEERDGALQIYKSDDRRIRAFPCLVHVDISVHDSKLHLLAIYRHWHLITKGYGNMLGLAALMQFLCQQSGYPSGELVVHAGMADSQRDDFGGARGVKLLMEDSERAGV